MADTDAAITARSIPQLDSLVPTCRQPHSVVVKQQDDTDGVVMISQQTGLMIPRFISFREYDFPVTTAGSYHIAAGRAGHLKDPVGIPTPLLDGNRSLFQRPAPETGDGATAGGRRSETGGGMGRCVLRLHTTPDRRRAGNERAGGQAHSSACTFLLVVANSCRKNEPDLGV